MEAFCYKLISFFKKIAYVLILSRATHLVNLHKDTCIYLKFLDYHLPYCHTMAVCKN